MMRAWALQLSALAVILPATGAQLRAQPASPAESRAQEQASFQRGLDLLGKKQFAEADQAFREALQLYPEDLRALQGRVAIREIQKQHEDALKLVQDAIAKYPLRIDLRVELGNVEVNAGQFDHAIAVFQDVLTALEKNSRAAGEVYLRLGEAQRRKDDLAAATVNLRRAADLLPENPQARYMFGMVLEGAGKREEALREYRAVLRLSPNNGSALNNVAYLLAETGGDLNEALVLALRAHELMPKVPEVADTLGWIYLKLNRTADAVAVLDEAVRKEPGGAVFRYHLGMALREKGDRLAAGQQLKAALECHPEPDLAGKIRALLQ